MEEPKIIIEKQPKNETGVKPVFIHASVHQQLKDISNESGISMGKLVERFVNHGLQYVEIVDHGADAE